MAVIFKANQANKQRDLVDRIKANLQTVGEAITEVTPRSAYEGNLPETLTMEHVNTLSRYNADFLGAAHVAVAETAGEHFVANPGVNKMAGTIGYFGPKDSIDIEVSRSKTFVNQFAKDPADRETTKHLVMRTAVNTVSTDGVGMKPLRDAISNEFADRFAK